VGPDRLSDMIATLIYDDIVRYTSGRGPVDFKISRGEDKTVIEIKLTSNNDCLHGFEVQIILQQ